MQRIDAALDLFHPDQLELPLMPMVRKPRGGALPVWHKQSVAMIAAAVLNACLLANIALPVRFNAPEASAPVVKVVAPAAKKVAQKAAKPAAPKLAQATLKKAGKKLPSVAYVNDQVLLARVMWHEARGQGRLGMLAAGTITLNRLKAGHNGRRTLSAVVNEPAAYTWVASPQKEKFNPRSETGKAAMELADRMLSHRLFADERALSQKLGNANHFHAVTMAKFPKWAFSPKLQRVALSKDEERALGAVFYGPREVTTQVASR